MPTWGELLQELAQIEGEYRAALEADPTTVFPTSPHDLLRQRYMKALTDRTGRAAIVYYSAWNEKANAEPDAISLEGADIQGFMEACSNIGSRELDLFIHSPGGNPDAVEQISGYLRNRFDSIRAVVPMTAMSAATMLALSTDEILMGSHSQLGPIDPQLTIQTPEGPRSSSAQAIKDQFALAKKECQDPSNIPAWLPILRGLMPGLLAACDHAADRAVTIVGDALQQYMFSDHTDPATDAKNTADWFGNAEEFKSHGRPVRRDEAREHGIKIVDLEEDQELQDLVLSVHHAITLTLNGTPTTKLIENHLGRAWLKVMPVLQIEGSPIPAFGPPAPIGPKPPPNPPRKRGKKKGRK